MQKCNLYPSLGFSSDSEEIFDDSDSEAINALEFLEQSKTNMTVLVNENNLTVKTFKVHIGERLGLRQDQINRIKILLDGVVLKDFQSLEILRDKKNPKIDIITA